MHADHAQTILEIFAYFEAETGRVLLANHFLAVGGRRGLSAEELQNGIEDAHRRGWIEPAELGWQLTQDGSTQASKMLHA